MQILGVVNKPVQPVIKLNADVLWIVKTDNQQLSAHNNWFPR